MLESKCSTRPYPGYAAMPKRNSTGLSRDTRGNYRRVIGKRFNGTSFTEATFYLGREAGPAAVNVVNLEKCWKAVQDRWQGTRDTQAACWDQTTYEIAKAVGLGKSSVLVPYPYADFHLPMPWDDAMLGV